MNTVGALALGAAVGASVMAVVGWRRWQRQQRALQWFQTRQSNEQTAQSETVREQLFQKAFALRRSLELGGVSVPEDATEPFEHCLALSADLNSALEQVSDQLSVPFIEDSLPLALQHFMQRWDDKTPDVALTLALPSDWPSQQADKHQLLLWCMHECLMQATPQKLTLALTQSNNIAKLQLSGHRQASKPLSADTLNLLTYIQQIFQILMPGQCRLTCTAQTFDCEFEWSLNSRNKE